MKIGISRAGKDPIRDILASAKRHGFEGVQLKAFQFQDHLASPQGFVDEVGDLSGLAQGGLIVYPGGDIAEWGAKIAAVVPFASHVGAGHICICAGVGRDDLSDAKFKEAADALMAAGRVAAAEGLLVSLHNHANSMFETAADIAKLAGMLDPAMCGLTIDTGHTAKAGIDDPGEVIRRHRDHVFNIHLKDMNADGSFCALGTGTVKLDAAIDAAKEIGYDRWLIIDEESKHLPTDEAFAITRDFLEGRGLLQ
jgi:inosose dehydratase